MEPDQPEEQNQQPKKPTLYRKQDSYYETVFRRPDVIKEAILNFAFNLCSWPRLVLEVFLRRDMGERYFSFGAVIMIFLVILFLVGQFIWLCFVLGVTKKVSYMCSGLVLFDFVFLWFGYQRHEEIKRLPSVFDFQRFSLSTGTAHPLLHRFSANRRQLATRYEPLVGFLAGVACLLLLQIPLALLLMGCSIIYALSYQAAYHRGENYVMDKIDEYICQQDIGTTFRDNVPYEQTRGAEYFGYEPKDPKTRQRMANALEQESEHEIR